MTKPLLCRLGLHSWIRAYGFGTITDLVTGEVKFRESEKIKICRRCEVEKTIRIRTEAS